MLQAVGASGCVPDEPTKVPKVDGAVVCDDEHLAVDFFVLKRLRLGVVGEQECTRREQVCVCHVLDVGEVEHVVVVADLIPAPSLQIDFDDVVLRLHVAFADDPGGADCGGEEVGVVGAVGVDDDFFGRGLGGGDKTSQHTADVCLEGGGMVRAGKLLGFFLPWSRCSTRSGPFPWEQATARLH